ncbi:MAG: hypothetical protein IT353_13730 [Gemmatimonadaceae bacterium]|nr:hypothetical protein [Gemmatimonadaceae bacterium]
MTAFACYWPWLLGGAALGWLAWQLFDRLFRRDGEEAGLRWKREYDGATATINTLNGDLGTAKGRVATLTSDWENSNVMLKAKTDEAIALRAQLAEWQNKYASLEDTSKSAAVAATTAAAAAAVAAAASLKSAEEKHTASQTALTAAQQELRTMTDDATRLRAELADCRSRYAAFEAKSTQSLTAATAIATAASFGFRPQRNGKDDLTIVEGIGPKINELLVAAGIDTFVKLADTPIARIQSILDAAGPTFRIANPATWPQQSALCARGAWEELKTLQDRLDAGVDPDTRKGV